MAFSSAAVLSVLAALVAGTLAIVVLRTSDPRPANRWLAMVLVGEALFLGTQVILHVAFESGAHGVPRWLEALTFGSVVGVSGAYLLLLSVLDTPLVRGLRARGVRVALAAFVLLVTASSYAFGTWASEATSGPGVVTSIVGMTTIVGVAAFAIVASVSAYRRTAPGTAARQRARAFLAAFATRDSLWVLGTVTALALEQAGANAWNLAWWAYGTQLTVLVYVPILTYGILRAQLFDIDLKIKVGISRSTVATIGLVVILAAAKVAEFYLNKTYGFIAGGIAAGVLLVLAPRLNRLGDKVASTALPKVQETPAYVQFRKLEVYKAALESAHEGGAPTEKELATLERLRVKLGIDPHDAAAIMADVRGSPPATA